MADEVQYHIWRRPDGTLLKLPVRSMDPLFAPGYTYVGPDGGEPSVPALPLLAGIGRDAENDRVLVTYCTRRPTDDEMRAIHDAARAAIDTLMEKP